MTARTPRPPAGPTPGEPTSTGPTPGEPTSTGPTPGERPSGEPTAVGPAAGWARLAPVVGTATAAVAAALVAAGLTGALRPSILVDTGPLVRWGLPAVTALTQLATALTVGALVLACLALPAPAGRGRAFEPALRLASATAGVWALGSVVLAVLQYADVSGLRLDDPVFGAGLAEFLTEIAFGRYYAISALIAAVLAVLAAGATSITSTGLLCLLALGGLIPPALAGHSAALSGHETAVTSLGLHLLGVSVWVGGLLTLILLYPALAGSGTAPGSSLGTAVSRFSGLAGWALVLVAGSGLVNANLRIPDLDAWTSPYGALVILKIAALVALGCAGWWQRRRLVPALGATTASVPPAAPEHQGTRARSAFVRFAAAETVVMGLAIGLAAALSRTAPPGGDGPGLAEISPAEQVTGYPMPPAPTVLRWLTAWQPDLFWVVVAALMAGLYLNGARRLRSRGDRWPVARTLSWLAGTALLVWITCGGPMVYGRVSFSGHMIAHMSLSMVVPLFLVFGAPVTLALRAVHARKDGTRGPREWLLGTLESRYVKVLAHPVTAAVLFAFSLVIFYYSVLFELALTTHLGHELMHVHFLLAGYLFANALVGIDPGPSRPPYPMRLLLLFATMGFHAFFGVALTQGAEVLQEAFFASLHRPWHADLLADQRLGGGIAWGLGEIPTMLLALILAVQWSRSDDREARRRDRAADRDGDAELEAYNAMLARLAGRSSARGTTGRDSR